MGNINFIASAGTGKTYNLVSEVIKKLKDEDTSLKNLLILTFTEKAATELKIKIAERIEEILSDRSVDKEDKKKLHKELLFLDSGYIGTFHSVFFRFLKRYPHISKIDNSFEIIDNQLDYFLDVLYEKWIEKDLEKEPEVWEYIAKIFSQKKDGLKNYFKILYKERLKLSKIDFSFEDEKEKIDNQINGLKGIIEDTFKKYSFLKNLPDKYYVLNLKVLLKILENKDLIKIESEDGLFKMPKEDEEIYSSLITKMRQIEGSSLEWQIVNRTQELEKAILDFNANVILKKAFDFIDFVEDIKNKERLLDFNDILYKTKMMLDENPDISQEIKNKFKYIFIDEFQDTDKIQIDIIKNISNNNIYIFGDPKQCIYTWRDADLEAYFDFINNNKFEDKALNINYRSNKKLVDFFNKMLSEGIILSYLDKKFKQSLSIPEDKDFCGRIRLIDLNKDNNKKKYLEEKARASVKIITDLINKGYEYKDIMILFRVNADLFKFKEILKSYNIPVSAPENGNIFDIPQVKTIINILKIIEYPKRKIELLQVLKSAFISLEDKDLYNLKDKLDINNLEIESLKVIKDIIKNKYNMTVEEIVDKIYQETDILESFSLIDETGSILENLKKFKIIAKQKTLENFSLRDFILFTETNTVSPAEVLEENAVRLLTMHKSKGLQSKVVIIPLIRNSSKPRNIYRYEDKIILNFEHAKNKDFFDYEDEIEEQLKQEEERLFYVAITRAEEELIFIKSNNLSEKNFGNFVKSFMDMEKFKDFIETENINIENIKIDTSFKIEKQNNYILDDLEKLKEKDELLEEIYQKSVEDKRFKSVSQIMAEEKDKENVGFRFSEEIDKNVGIYTGIVIHNIFEDLDFSGFSKDKIDDLIKQKEGLIPEAIKNEVIERCRYILEKFENSDIHNELKNSKILFRELPFILYENEKYIEGRIDIIYERDSSIIVMDYKTNIYKNPEEKEIIIKSYEKQKEYYLKAIEKMFPEKNIIFKLALLWNGEIIEI